MSISDLTGTTWTFASDVSYLSETTTFFVNFTAYNPSTEITMTYSQFVLVSPSSSTSSTVQYYNLSFRNVYSLSTGWSDDWYRTITFTGGDDVTNATLIAWVEANAIVDEPVSYIGYNGVSHKITNAYIGVGGTSRHVLRGYVGNSHGQAELFYDQYVPLVNSYSVAKNSSASYGFVQCSNTSDTYYFGDLTTYDNTWCRSNNYNVSSSTAYSVLTFDIQYTCTLAIDVVDYKNESSYDYGLVYDLDSSTTTKHSGQSNHVSGGATLDYGTVAVGTHTIIVKYIKDGSVNNANDRLYFRVKLDGVATAPTSVTI